MCFLLPRVVRGEIKAHEEAEQHQIHDVADENRCGLTARAPFGINEPWDQCACRKLQLRVAYGRGPVVSAARDSDRKLSGITMDASPQSSQASISTSARKTGGVVDAHDEASCDFGVESARVARFVDFEDFLDPGDDFVRGWIRRLVQVDHTVLLQDVNGSISR